MTSQYLAYYILAYIYSSKTYIYQCALQAVGKSKFVLVTTAAINFFVLILMLIFTFPLHAGLIGIAFCYFINELVAGIIYKREFIKIIDGT